MAEWTKTPVEPVLDGRYGTMFDVCLLKEDGRYRMWVSWLPLDGIAVVESEDGIAWTLPEMIFGPAPTTGWEDTVNRPIVVFRDGLYHLWYTGQTSRSSSIGYATSSNGRQWQRRERPVLEASEPWEGEGLMCPHVLWDEAAGLWRMWYSGGGLEEPVAIGHATSTDGVVWTKHAANPVLAPDPANEWEQERATGAQIVPFEDGYVAFYIGFRDIDTAQIGLALSKDGLGEWTRHPGNPIVRPTPGGWDADACYKPFAIRENGGWTLWYNGRNGDDEQIGRVRLESESLKPQ